MEFEWDEEKRLKVLDKHGVDFVKAVQVFRTDHVVMAARSEEEPRFAATACLNGEWYTVIFTVRGDVRRLITARKARENERRAYRSVYS